MKDPVETEIKLRVRDPQEIRERLRAAGATVARARHFEDNALFDARDGRLASSGQALRVREAEGQGTFTFKGPKEVRDGMKSRLELEVGVSDPRTLARMLQHLGLQPVFRYQKWREVWRLGDVEVVVDETPIGCFIEIEGAAAGIHDAARALGHGPSEYLSDSYAALFQQSGKTGDMVFP